MTFSKRIVIERYPEETAQGCGYAGLIEGETESGVHWILWLDSEGRPEIFWPERDDDGSVTGDGVFLIPDSAALQGHSAEMFANLVAEIGDGEPAQEHRHILARCAYSDRTIRFRDRLDESGDRFVTVISKRTGIEVEGPSTALAYWAYRKELATRAESR